MLSRVHMLYLLTYRLFSLSEKPIGQLYRKPPPVLDLPDLVVKKARRKTDKSTTDTPLNLSLLFSDQSS